jgi:hypothetical protein
MMVDEYIEVTMSSDDTMPVDFGEVGLFLAPGSAFVAEVTLLASAWSGSDRLWSQVVNIDGITSNCKVDLTPSAEQLLIFHEKDVAFTTENEDRVVTVFAVGDRPTNDYTIQAIVTEVAVE